MYTRVLNYACECANYCAGNVALTSAAASIRNALKATVYCVPLCAGLNYKSSPNVLNKRIREGETLVGGAR